MDRKRVKAWPTVVIIAILAVLILTGHNGAITLSMFAAVGVYLGIDLTFLHKWRQ